MLRSPPSIHRQVSRTVIPLLLSHSLILLLLLIVFISFSPSSSSAPFFNSSLFPFTTSFFLFSPQQFKSQIFGPNFYSLSLSLIPFQIQIQKPSVRSFANKKLNRKFSFQSLSLFLSLPSSSIVSSPIIMFHPFFLHTLSHHVLTFFCWPYYRTDQHLRLSDCKKGFFKNPLFIDLIWLAPHSIPRIPFVLSHFSSSHFFPSFCETITRIYARNLSN